MFSHFEYMALHTTQRGYGNVHFMHFSDVLSFKPGSGEGACSQANGSANDLIMGLENYIRTNLELYCPDWIHDPNYEKDDWRKVLGDQFRKAQQSRPDLYPLNMDHACIFTQLNKTTQYRHKRAHKYHFGNSGIYKRYPILKTYDVILCYLLYSFYCMCLSPDYEKHPIKWN